MTTVAIIGLGYVGLPLAIEFGKKIDTIGYDCSAQKITAYLNQNDPAKQIMLTDFQTATKLTFTHDPKMIRSADFIIIAVPRPLMIATTLIFPV